MLMPLAYIARIFSSNPARRRSYLGISSGSKVPSRSRGVVILSRPESPWTVLAEVPLRRLRPGRFAVVGSPAAGSGAAAASGFGGRRPALEPHRGRGSPLEMHLHLGVEDAFDHRLGHRSPAIPSMG